MTNVNTVLPGGQADNQAFCYDEQNRLTWAGSTGTPMCAVALTSSGGWRRGRVRRRGRESGGDDNVALRRQRAADGAAEEMGVGAGLRTFSAREYNGAVRGG